PAPLTPLLNISRTDHAAIVKRRGMADRRRTARAGAAPDANSETKPRVLLLLPEAPALLPDRHPVDDRRDGGLVSLRARPRSTAQPRWPHRHRFPDAARRGRRGA